MRKLLATLLVMVFALSTAGFAQHGNGNGNGNGKGHGNNHGGDDDDVQQSPYIFTGSDRLRIENCLSDPQGLPPGLAKREQLPPGLQKHIQKNGQLPPGLQKKVQPLPAACEARLPRLPSGYSRVILGNYVILKDIHDRIIDLIEWNRRN